jgi:ribonuclease III
LDRPSDFEARVGYRFRDAGLLEQALTHRSYGSPHNERLEFLGDSVLGCIMAEALCARFPALTEGQLTRMKAMLVREETLSDAARSLGVAAAIRLGEGERGRGTDIRTSILADALEAVFGAIFVDGGYAAARAVVLALYAERLDRVDAQGPRKDAKTRLQEFLQGQHKARPEYRVVQVRGAAHRQTFDVECVVADLDARATGSGSSRQRAEQEAAAALLESIGQ